jgi:hypothetical protein
MQQFRDEGPVSCSVYGPIGWCCELLEVWFSITPISGNLYYEVVNYMLKNQYKQNKHCGLKSFGLHNAFLSSAMPIPRISPP